MGLPLARCIIYLWAMVLLTLDVKHNMTLPGWSRARSVDQPAPEPENGNGGSTSSALQSELLANITGLHWFSLHATLQQASTSTS